MCFQNTIYLETININILFIIFRFAVYVYKNKFCCSSFAQIVQETNLPHPLDDIEFSN